MNQTQPATRSGLLWQLLSMPGKPWTISAGTADWKARQCMCNAHAGSRIRSGKDSREQLSRQPHTPKCSVSTCSQQIAHGAHDPSMVLVLCLRVRYLENSGANQRHRRSRGTEMAGGVTRARHEWTLRVTSLAQRGMKNTVTLNRLVTHASCLNTYALVREDT